MLEDTGSASFDVVKALTSGKRFFITRGGRFGIGPAATEKGDTIFVLGTYGVPFLLRVYDQPSEPDVAASSAPGASQSPSRDCNSGGECPSLVGECYAQGLMSEKVFDSDHPKVTKPLHIH
jgi:hypothetical protein